MYARLQQAIRQRHQAIAISAAAAAIALGLNGIGSFRWLEWSVYDSFVRWQPEATIDSRILLVTIRERDINTIGQWPLPDRIFAQVIQNLSRHQPAAIGLDIYRDLPVEPGHAEWQQVVATTPNLIGAYKLLGETVAPPPALVDSGRIGFIDLSLDGDGKVRRALLSHHDENDRIQSSFAVRLADLYLRERGLNLQPVPPSRWERWLSSSDRKRFRWGRATFEPLQQARGIYRQSEIAGYQIPIAYRGQIDRFESVSLLDVLDGKVDESLVRDRVVLIGSLAPSLNDLFATPYSSPFESQANRMAGLAIHANILSQILSATLDGRRLISPLPQVYHGLWVTFWGATGASLSWWILCRYRYASLYLLVGSAVVMLLLYGIGWVVLGWGYWMPVVAPAFAFLSSTTLATLYYSYSLQRLVGIDSLTKINNRYACDRFLADLWPLGQSRSLPLCIILCDVDFFKKYNDVNGHQAGDRCLQIVAHTITKAVRHTDFVARYGGEEFIAILPNTQLPEASQVAERICHNVKALKLPHPNSTVGPFVTLSCGVASTQTQSFSSIANLIETADLALYAAKAEGRDRYSFKASSSVSES